jgi:hypothetical protein
MRTRAHAVFLLLLVPPSMAVPPRPPLAVREAVPGRLRVRIFATDLPGSGTPVACWLFATDGFRALGQKEMVLSVLRRSGEAAEAFPEDPVAFYASLFPFAAQGQRVSEGGYTWFAGARFLGREDIRGMTYTRLDPLRSPLLQPDALLVVPLTASEMEAAQRFGALRVLGLLGAHHRVFPWAGFFDRDRPSLAPAPGDWDTILGKTRVVQIRGVRVAAELPASASPLIGQGNLLVSLPAASRAAILEAVVEKAEEGAVALAAELDPEADALAVYRPGQKGPYAIRPGDGPVSRLAGSFVTFLPSKEEGDLAKLYEDGFVVMLTEASRKSLHEALRAGRDLELLGGPGSLAIRIRWRD